MRTGRHAMGGPPWMVAFRRPFAVSDLNRH